MKLRFKGDAARPRRVKLMTPRRIVASGHDETCPDCHGTGKIDGHDCGKCHGTGHISHH